LGSLAARLGADALALVGDLTRLAAAELRDNAKALRPAVALGAAAFGLLVVGIGAAGACAVLLLALVVPAWAATLLVALCVLSCSWACARAARTKLAAAMAPLPQTGRALEEAIEWIRVRSTL
jgi:hypothetical protein